MKHIAYIFLLSLWPFFLCAQQLPDRSIFAETNFLWNPAMTGAFPFWELSTSYRQQWLGFDNAPRTAAVAIQYPLPESNSALGGYFMYDQINPLVVNHFTFQYAYKLRFGDRKRRQLSLGIAANVQHFLVNARSVVVNHADDPLLPAGEYNTVGPNASGGIFYTSDARQSDNKGAWYAGAAIQQAVPWNVVFDDNDSPANLRHTWHGNAIFGGRFAKGGVILEPALWVHYAQPGIVNGAFHLRAESQDALWGGLSYSTNQTLGIQAGVVVKKGFKEFSHLRIGVAGTFNIGTFGQFRGPGYEFLMAYRMAQD